jgi:hypothetical protein
MFPENMMDYDAAGEAPAYNNDVTPPHNQRRQTDNDVREHTYILYIINNPRIHQMHNDNRSRIFTYYMRLRIRYVKVMTMLNRLQVHCHN